MITANYIPAADNRFLLQLNFPASTRKEYATVNGYEGAQRVLYFHTRKYITQKLSSWLRQRLYVAGLLDDKQLIPRVASLYTLVQFHQNTGLIPLCKIIAKHSNAFEACAPGILSKHFNYYVTVIAPIVAYCNDFSREDYHG